MKTDNSHICEKVDLRLKAISQITSEIHVLEAFSGESVLWDEVKRMTDRELIITRIEKKVKKGTKLYLQGDNLKWLLSINLQKYNIIDLDSYGIPYDQLNILFKREYKGIIICTAIQSVIGCLPNGMLNELGFTKQMIKKIPTLFFRHGLEKLENYLYLHGVKTISGYFIDRKNYFMFNT